MFDNAEKRKYNFEEKKEEICEKGYSLQGRESKRFFFLMKKDRKVTFAVLKMRKIVGY